MILNKGAFLILFALALPLGVAAQVPPGFVPRHMLPKEPPPPPPPPPSRAVQKCLVDYASKAGSDAAVGVAHKACRDWDETSWTDFARRAELRCILNGVKDAASRDAAVTLVHACKQLHNPDAPQAQTEHVPAPRAPAPASPAPASPAPPSPAVASEPGADVLDRFWNVALDTFLSRPENQYLAEQPHAGNFTIALQMAADENPNRAWGQMMERGKQIYEAWLGAQEPEPAGASAPRPGYGAHWSEQPQPRRECVYKGVMTDEEIAICRAEARRS